MAYRQSNDEQLNKLRIAAHHVEAAIQMIAIDSNPFSIHLPVMAADELIETLAKYRSLNLPYDSSIYVRPEFQDEWRRRKRKAYNFFKHADRDPTDTYDGPSAENLTHLNDLQTVFNIIGLRTLGFEIPEYMTKFFFLVGTMQPHLIQWKEIEAEHPELAAARQNLPPIDRALFLQTLRKVLILPA